MKKSSSQLVFNGEVDVVPKADGIPSIAHQLRQTFARNSMYRSSSSMVQFAPGPGSDANS